MINDEWAGLPKLGTRVRVPFPNASVGGEVILHYRLFGRPVARVRAQLPVSHEPYETYGVTVLFRPDGMEIISEPED